MAAQFLGERDQHWRRRHDDMVLGFLAWAPMACRCRNCLALSACLCARGIQDLRFTQAGVDGVRRVLRGEYTVRFGVRDTAALGMGFAEVKVFAE